MIVTLPLTNYTDKLCFIDYEDLERCSKYKWYFDGRRIVATIKHNTMSLARFITGVKRIDHKDRNQFHNCRRNFRIATEQQNNFNRTKRIGCSSKYKGVSWNKKLHKWQVLITINKKTKHLGYFESEELAAKVYSEAALKLFGKFAVLNTF